MRILIVSGSDISRIGGILVGIREVARRLAANGDECTVLSINPGGLPEEDWIEGIHIIRVDSPISRRMMEMSPELGLKFMSIIRGLPSVEIIHLHGYASLLSHEIAFLCKIAGKKYIYTPHYSPFAHIHPLADLLFKLGRPLGSGMTFDYAQRVICISRFESSIVGSHFGTPFSRITIIPNGVDLVEHRNDSAMSRKESDPIRLLYVGYLIELKGVQHILRAVQRLVVGMRLEVELVVAGSGYYESSLRELAANLGISDRVEWIGEVEKGSLATLYRDADISLLLSASENFGTVVAESLALGTPVIVTTNSALAEFVNERGCYGIEDPSDSEKLADLILEILRNGIGVGPLTEKIQTWDSVARQIRELYDHVYCELYNREETTAFKTMHS